MVLNTRVWLRPAGYSGINFDNQNSSPLKQVIGWPIINKVNFFLVI